MTVTVMLVTALLLVVASSLLAFFSLPTSVVDDIACVLVAVDGVMSAFALVLNSSCPTGLGPTADRVVSQASPSTRGHGLLLLLDGSRYYHRPDPSCHRGSHVALAEHGDERIHERRGGDEVLLGRGEDALSTAVHLHDIALKLATLSLELFVALDLPTSFFLQALAFCLVRLLAFELRVGESANHEDFLRGRGAS